jgi:hypothetical protein
MLDGEHNFRTGVSRFVLNKNPKSCAYSKLEDQHRGKAAIRNGSIRALLEV